MARNKKVEILSHDGQVLHPITDGDCVIFPDGETLAHKLSEQEEVMYTPEVVNSSPMFKVGEGDSSDYSANVLDGAYQEAVLKGQTYVNTIQEPSADVITLPTPFTEYERTQSKTFTEMQDGTFGLNLVGQSYVNCIQEPSEPSYVALGENLEFQNKKVEYTTDGQIKSAMLNGQTLVNVFQFTSKSDFSSSEKMILDGTTIIFNADGTYQNFWLKNNGLVKANTTYLFIVDILENTLVYKDGMLDTESVLYITSSVSNNNDSNFFPAGVVISKNDLKQNKFIKKLASNPTSTGDELLLTRPFLSPNAISGTIKFKVMIIEYQEGMENWDIPYFEGMQSVTMTTELENVCSRYNSSGAKNGKTFTVSSAATRSLKLSTAENISSYNFKQNTKYLLQFKITNLNLDGLENVKLYFSESNISEGNALFGDLANAMVRITKNGIHRVVLTTSSIANISGFVIKGLGTEWENTTSTTRKLTISQIMCIEYQNGMENWDLPYFETTQLMKPIIINSSNKNLICLKDIMNGKTINSDNGDISNNELRQVSGLIKVKPNTTYTVSQDYTTTQQQIFIHQYSDKNISSTCAILWEKDKVQANDNQGMNNYYVWAKNKATFTTSSNAKYIAVRTQNNMTITGSKIQVEENNTSSTYVVPQTQRISALEPITLRAIGNVKDTLDLSTGEYVQRIGEIVLDGSDDEGWKMGTNSEVNAYRFDTEIISGKIPSVSNTALANIMCDKYKAITFSNAYYNRSQGIAIFSNTHIVISNGMTNLEDFKLSLQNNPIKVQYELAKPITRKISLEYPNLQTYQDITHVQSIAMDGTLIPKIFLPSDISYKAMLKPNTSYNVIVDREVIDSTNQLTVNLGGATANITANRTVVRTPSTLSSETLTFSGKDNRLAKAMLIEGSTLINGDLPHFDGIGDVKLGRVVENLCMANEMVAGGATVTSTLYTDRIELKITKEGSCVETFELTKQLQNGKKYFVYCPWDCSNSSYVFGAGFKMSYNDNTNFGRQVTGVNNKKYIIFTIDEKEQLNPYTHFTIGFHGSMAVNTTMTIRRPILCEYIDGMENWDWESIGYFTGTRNIGNEFMRIGNKNLFDSNNLVMGSCQYWGKEFYFYVPSDNRATMTELIKVKSGSTLTLKYNSNFNGVIQEYISPSQKTKDTDVGWQIGQHILKLDEKTNYVNIYFRKIDDTQFTTDELNTLKNSIQLEEASSATSYVVHKHNSLHILPNEQIPLTFVQGTIAYAHNGTWENAINNTNTTRIRTQLLDLEPNETYRVSCGHSNHGFGCQGYDNSLLAKSDSGWTYDEYYFTTTKDVHKYAINVRYKDNSNITPSVLHQIRLEKVTDVTLRSVGDVKDELDLTRSVYIQRIKEVVFDGSDDEKWKASTSQGYFSIYTGDAKAQSASGNSMLVICDKYTGKLQYSVANDKEDGICTQWNTTDLLLVDSTIELNVDSLRKKLQQNPIRVQYVLETPIEHKINIPMKNELNQTIAKPNGVFTLPLMYSETNHVDINSQIYPKVQSRDYIAYPVIANNSQLHTVFHNKLGTGNLTVNLCGTNVTSVDGTSKCTVTTPSTISQYELRLSGARNKVSNVCVFSGDYMNVNVPYVEGMMNAVNPIVKNASLNHANIATSGHTNFYIGRIYKGKTYSLKLNRSKNVGYNLVLKHGTAVDGGEEMLKDFIFSDFTTFTSNYNGYLYFNGWETVDVDNIMLCLGTYTEQNMPQYEPYKENICEPHSEDIIHLRSLPNGVRDELNLQTGEYIQRIVEINIRELSKMDNMVRKGGWDNGVYMSFDIMTPDAVKNKTNAITTTSNLFQTVIRNLESSNSMKEFVTNTASGNLFVMIRKDRLISSDLNGFKQWLEDNDLVIQYELATPVIKQVDIHNYPHSYKDGHVIIENSDPTTSVPAQLTYKCVTNRSGQIQEHTEQVEKQERQINELETLILENIRLSQNRSQNFLTSLISTLEIEEE